MILRRAGAAQALAGRASCGDLADAGVRAGLLRFGLTHQRVCVKMVGGCDLFGFL